MILCFSLIGCTGNSPSAVAKGENDDSTVAEEDGTRVEQEIEEPAPITADNAREILSEYGEEHHQQFVSVHTRFGDIKIRLYENTPMHRASFLMLTNRGYFDNTWFYRVSVDHVIQAGNTDSRETIEKRERIGDYRVPAELESGNYHKYGAVAAARSYSGNPDKGSDPYEFYIVLGKAYSRSQLKLLAEKHDLSFTVDQLDFYQNRRGAPHLDGEHTVFGEVIEGMDVVEKINAVKVDEGEWPLMNIPIEVEVVK